MNHQIPDWLKDQPRSGFLRTKPERDLTKLMNAKKAEGYIECLNDLKMGLTRHKINLFSLYCLEPVMRTIMLKAEIFSQEAKK